MEKMYVAKNMCLYACMYISNKSITTKSTYVCMYVSTVITFPWFSKMYVYPMYVQSNASLYVGRSYDHDDDDDDRLLTMVTVPIFNCLASRSIHDDV